MHPASIVVTQLNIEKTMDAIGELTQKINLFIINHASKSTRIKNRL